MKLAALLSTALFLGACASQPETDRAVLPDRPEVHRPDGVEPDGLADIRSQLADQRNEARARDNALQMNRTPMQQAPTTWYGSVWQNTVGGLLRWMGL